MTAVLIDDDPNANFVLTETLKAKCPQVRIIAVCASPTEGAQALLFHKPDLIFLDVEMPGETGFELLQRTQPSGEVIFVTGFEQYALQALNLSAAYYLLKPVEADELAKAVERASTLQDTKRKLLQYEVLREILEAQKQQRRPKRLLLPDAQHGHELVSVEEICYLEASGSYTHFHLQDKRVLITSKNLAHYERDLSDLLFKAHRSYLINPLFIRFIDKGQDKIILKNGEKIPVSRGATEDLLKLVQTLS